MATRFHVEIVLLKYDFHFLPKSCLGDTISKWNSDLKKKKKNPAQQPLTLKSWIQDTISILKLCFQNTFLKQGYFTKLFQNNNNLIN